MKSSMSSFNPRCYLSMKNKEGTRFEDQDCINGVTIRLLLLSMYLNSGLMKTAIQHHTSSLPTLIVEEINVGTYRNPRIHSANPDLQRNGIGFAVLLANDRESENEHFAESIRDST